MKIQSHKDADCYAGKMLRDVYHYTPFQFENVYEFLREDHRDLDREEALRNCVNDKLVVFPINQLDQ